MVHEGWRRFRHDGIGLELDVPPGWASIRDTLGCAVLLLEPAEGPEVFRTSLNVTVEVGDEVDLDELIRVQVAASARALTALKVHSVASIEVEAGPARHVEASYREGETDVALEQWMLAVPFGAVALTATYSIDRGPEIKPHLDRIVGGISLGGAGRRLG